MTITDIAIICHEANRAYYQTLNDNSQPSWGQAPTWQKESVEAGVKLIIENPDTTPSMAHEAWMKDKLAGGWKWGAVKDPLKLEHPCMMAYDQLPKAQQVNDYLFGGIVRALRRFVV